MHFTENFSIPVLLSFAFATCLLKIKFSLFGKEFEALYVILHYQACARALKVCHVHSNR